MTTQTFHRDSFTWLAYILLAFYGYFLNILGPITPFLKDELNLSYTVSSLHFTAFALGILLVGLAGHALVRRLGRWRCLWIGTFGMSCCVLILLAGRSPIMTISAAFLMGLVGSLILVIVPSSLSDLHGEYRAVALSEANVVASLVSMIAPLMVGWCTGLPGGWRLALGIAALSPIVLRLVFKKSDASVSNSAQESSASTGEPLPVIYWVYWSALVLSVSVEFCMIFWSADYLETHLGMQKANAAQAVSLFLGGMIVGRLAGSRLVQRFSTHWVTICSVLMAAVGFILFWMTKSASFGMAGLFITGLGVASLYPLILSLAIGSAPNNTVQASVRATLASGFAILILPLSLGWLADWLGIWKAYSIVTVLLIGILLLMLATKRKSKT